MTLSAGRLRTVPLAAVLLVAVPFAFAQQKPLARRFVPSAQEHYQVTLNLKAESHSVTTETVATQTYVKPLVHEEGVSIRWLANRRVLSVQADGSAEIEETLRPIDQQCGVNPQAPENPDAELQASLKAFCAFWLRGRTIRYTESPRGLLQGVDASPNDLLPLGEDPPQLLSLWLRHAVRPSVVFPKLQLEIGAKSHQSFQPADKLLRNAHGSETSEWLDAPGESPAVILHVVQQLSWIGTHSSGTSSMAPPDAKPEKDESFFADSLTTLALQDFSVLHASRTASHKTARRVEAVPGLPQPPDFSLKLILSVTIERLP